MSGATRHELDAIDQQVTPSDPHEDAVRLARLRVLRALRDLDRGRRRYRAAYQRLLRTQRDPEARKAAHRLEIARLRRLEQGLDEAIRGMGEAEDRAAQEAQEAQEALAVRVRLEGWP